MQEIRITKKQLETFATGSLMGYLYNQQYDEREPVKILFEQTSLDWRHENAGPDYVIIPEYTIGCMIEDILLLMQRGMKIEVGTWTNDPVPTERAL